LIYLRTIYGHASDVAYFEREEKRKKKGKRLEEVAPEAEKSLATLICQQVEHAPIRVKQKRSNKMVEAPSILETILEVVEDGEEDLDDTL
ncbi:hypothetical protein, partial [Paenarthrobacter aurescens]|uniref:hypothetical protein n=1 Tax=Paenarthrobacter aurescens TaxID=43663 RepID=UPI0021C161AD